jgi:hypothetical protein
MSKIEVNTVEPQCGTTLTLGGSGDTVALGSGASQTGFGRTGTVDWVTTPKTSTFTAVNGEGYFINSGSALTANLPAGSAGAIVSFSDYARNFATYNFSVSPNGSEKIGGQASDAKLSVDGQAATFVYVDSTKGWINIQNAEDTETGLEPYVAATGGNTTITCGDYKTHIFTSPGPFSVSNSGGACGSNTVEYLVVAGGAGGGTGSGGGGGGAGGYRTTYPSPATGGLPVAIQCYPIDVGAGGSATQSPTPSYPPSATNNGSNSVFSSITSAGGGGGGQEGSPAALRIGADGGSGGGGAYSSASPGGSGNTPPTPVPQGNNGGQGGCTYGGGGGGGASAVGANQSGGSGGAGGIGTAIACAAIGPTSPSYGTPGPASGRYFSGGGGGGGQQPGPTFGPGGAGGGGRGGYYPGPTGGTAGTDNTGGGGGGGGGTTNAALGGSGIVIIRYKFQ